MNTYKVIFARNVVLSCVIENHAVLNKEYYYEHDKGQLMYALINAENEADAIHKSNKIIREVTEMIFGNDYII